MRTFTLYGPILCYHEEPDIESVADPSRPRARLNLSKTETIAEMHSKHKPVRASLRVFVKRRCLSFVGFFSEECALPLPLSIAHPRFHFRATPPRTSSR